MKRYKVTFDIFMSTGNTVNETVTVEAGNKKNACMRAMLEISKKGIYAGNFKQVKSVEEVA